MSARSWSCWFAGRGHFAAIACHGERMVAESGTEGCEAHVAEAIEMNAHGWASTMAVAA
jgi:hypothetical protein